MNNTAKKIKKPAIVIMKRELSSYFSSPIAYIVTGLFLIITGILFFTNILPSEPRKFKKPVFPYADNPFLLYSGTYNAPLFRRKAFGSIETLYTLPVTEFDAVCGKFLAALTASAAMVAPTLIYLISMLPFGLPEPGPVAGGYLGTLFLCAAFSAIGVFASSITKNQIIAFFTAFIICIVLTMISEFLIFLPGPIVEFLSFISANQHFTSISRGIIDTRDLVYFVSLTAFFFSLTVICQQNERK